MSRPKTKKAAPKGKPKTTPKGKGKPKASPTPKAAPRPRAAPTATPKADGVKLARHRRLARAGFEGADCCPLLGVELDVGPRANRWQRPRMLDGEPVSALAMVIIEAGPPPEALERAAAVLRAADGGSK